MLTRRKKIILSLILVSIALIGICAVSASSDVDNVHTSADDCVEPQLDINDVNSLEITDNTVEHQSCVGKDVSQHVAVNKTAHKHVPKHVVNKTAPKFVPKHVVANKTAHKFAPKHVVNKTAPKFVPKHVAAKNLALKFVFAKLAHKVAVKHAIMHAVINKIMFKHVVGKFVHKPIFMPKPIGIHHKKPVFPAI